MNMQIKRASDVQIGDGLCVGGFGNVLEVEAVYRILPIAGGTILEFDTAGKGLRNPFKACVHTSAVDSFLLCVAKADMPRMSPVFQSEGPKPCVQPNYDGIDDPAQGEPGVPFEVRDKSLERLCGVDRV